MPKVTAATLAVTALIVLGLTGCTGTPESTGDERTAPQTSESPAAVETETPDEPELSETEQAWVDNETWDTFAIAKEDRLPSAMLACEEFAAGKTTQEMTLPGVPADLTDYFANGARDWFCPAS